MKERKKWKKKIHLVVERKKEKKKERKKERIEFMKKNAMWAERELKFKEKVHGHRGHTMKGE